MFDKPEDDISNESTNSIMNSVICRQKYKVNTIPVENNIVIIEA